MTENLWADLELASGPNNTVTLADERPASVAITDSDVFEDGRLVETVFVEITVDLDACAARVSLPLNLLLTHISTAMGLR